MTNKNIQQCKKKANCKLTAKYNYIGNKYPIYCRKHKKKNMINLIDGKCNHGLFTKCNQYAFLADANKKSAKIYCLYHGKITMINIMKMNCKYCDKRAFFNYPNLSIPKFCNDHKQFNMIVSIKRICRKKLCKNYASFNKKGKIMPKYCNIHAKNRMINVKYICRVKKCLNLAQYSYLGGYYPLFCYDHRKNSKYKTIKAFNICNNKNCNLISSYGYRNDNIKLYCLHHKTKSMVNIDNIVKYRYVLVNNY